MKEIEQITYDYIIHLVNKFVAEMDDRTELIDNIDDLVCMLLERCEIVDNG